MGAAASSTPTTADEAKAFLGDAAWTAECEALYGSGKLVTQAELLRAAFPAGSGDAILARARAMTPAERDDEARRVLQWHVDRERAKPQQKKRADDYGASFSGSAQDTADEREAAALLRGDDADTDDNEDAVALSEAQRDELERLGKWVKFLSSAGCYAYVHSLTREVRSNRPDAFQDDEAEATTDEAGTGLPTVNFADVPAEIKRILEEEKKTPLALDASDDRKLAAFYGYNKSAVVLDATRLALPMRDKLRPKAKALIEEARQHAVRALKAGATFVLDLGDAEGSKAPFLSQWCKNDGLRKELFVEGGAALARNKMALGRMFRDDEKEYGQCLVRDGFACVVVSKLAPDVFQAELADTCLDLSACYPFVIAFPTA